MQSGGHGHPATWTAATRPRAIDSRLENSLRELYRPTDKYPGGTAAAIREQLATGHLIGGHDHLVKGQERARRLENLLNSGRPLNQVDQAIAVEALMDLLNALGGN